MALEYTPKFQGVSICPADGQDFRFTLPLVYNGSEWKHVRPKVWDGTAWRDIGGAFTQLVPLYVTNGDNFQTSASQDVLVHEVLGKARLKDSGGNYLLTSEGHKLYGIYEGA